MLMTAWVGMYMADSTRLSFTVWLYGTLGIGFIASAAAVVNQLVDRHIDAKMSRTQNRPLVAGNISPKRALQFAMILAALGLLVLLTRVNTVTAIWCVLGLLGYAGIYTGYLKHSTPQNIVIGGAAGAIPPILGWTSVTGQLTAGSWLLALIIFVWTPPHFWALAIARMEDYKNASIPMLPVTHGISFTKLCILLYSFLLLAVSLLPYVIGMSGHLYLISALILGLIFLYYAFAVYRVPSNARSLKLFHWSITYLLLLFSALLIDHGLI